MNEVEQAQTVAASKQDLHEETCPYCDENGPKPEKVLGGTYQETSPPVEAGKPQAL